MRRTTLATTPSRQPYTHTTTSRLPEGYKGIYIRKLPKLDLTTDAEYVANLVNVKYVVVNVQQCSLLHGYAIPA